MTSPNPTHPSPAPRGAFSFASSARVPLDDSHAPTQPGGYAALDPESRNAYPNLQCSPNQNRPASQRRAVESIVKQIDRLRLTTPRDHQTTHRQQRQRSGFGDFLNLTIFNHVGYRSLFAIKAICLAACNEVEAR